MLYLPIAKDWIISRGAERVYLVCAVLTLAMFGTWIAANLALTASGSSSLADSALAAALVKSLLFPGVLGAALLSIAMWYFWFSFDPSSWAKRSLWFLPLYFLLGIGPVLYFFFVYRSKRATAKGARASSSEIA